MVCRFRSTLSSRPHYPHKAPVCIREWSLHSCCKPQHNNPHIMKPLDNDLWPYGLPGPLIGQKRVSRLRGERRHSRSFVRWNKSRIQLKTIWESLPPSPTEGLWTRANPVLSCCPTVSPTLVSFVLPYLFSVYRYSYFINYVNYSNQSN